MEPQRQPPRRSPCCDPHCTRSSADTWHSSASPAGEPALSTRSPSATKRPTKHSRSRSCGPSASSGGATSATVQASACAFAAQIALDRHERELTIAAALPSRYFSTPAPSSTGRPMTPAAAPAFASEEASRLGLTTRLEWTSCERVGKSWRQVGRRLLAWSKAAAHTRARAHRARRSRPGFRMLQSWSPAVADIIGARRACTVEMISSISMPCR